MRRGRGPIDFAVVGAQKAGTTHLNVCLADHPQLHLCRDEVPYFEDPFYENSDPVELERALQRARPDQLRGIHRPEYLGRPECAARIRADAPDARILVVLRDPVGRAVSAYSWYVQFGLLPLVPLEEGLSRLLDGQDDPQHPRGPEVLHFGRYGEHVKRFLDTFGSEQVLVMLTEELEAPELTRRVYEFLGVDPDHVSRRVAERTNPGIYEPHRLRFLRRRRHLGYSWDEATTYTYRRRRLRRPLAVLASASLLAVDRVVLSRIYGNPPPRLSTALEARLRDYYDSDLVLLEAQLGRSFAAWRQVSRPTSEQNTR